MLQLLQSAVVPIAVPRLTSLLQCKALPQELKWKLVCAAKQIMSKLLLQNDFQKTLQKKLPQHSRTICQVPCGHEKKAHSIVVLRGEAHCISWGNQAM